MPKLSRGCSFMLKQCDVSICEHSTNKGHYIRSKGRDNVIQGDQLDKDKFSQKIIYGTWKIAPSINVSKYQDPTT